MRILDLFCCAGGAGMGYHRAGFEVVGVDINPQPNYPFECHHPSTVGLEARDRNGVEVWGGPAWDATKNPMPWTPAA